MAFDQAIADRICELIAEGITLREILRRNPDFPKWRTVHLWRNEQPQFEAAYREARKMGFDAIAEETIEIADDGSNDWTVRQKGEEQVNDLDGEHVQRSKLRIDTRLKLLAKWDPARYGDRVTQELVGKDGGPVEFTEIRRTVVDPKKP